MKTVNAKIVEPTNAIIVREKKFSRFMKYWPMLVILVLGALLVWIWTPRTSDASDPSKKETTEKTGLLHLTEKDEDKKASAPQITKVIEEKEIITISDSENERLKNELKALKDKLEEQEIQREAAVREDESRIRLVNPGEPRATQANFPVAEWRVVGSYLVPLRKMPDGLAGYGNTYSRPPSGGVLPDQTWAKEIAKSGNGFVRNERGDWAIALR